MTIKNKRKQKYKPYKNYMSNMGTSYKVTGSRLGIMFRDEAGNWSQTLYTKTDDNKEQT